MPVPAAMAHTTGRREPRARFVIGADGCRAGWACVRLNLHDNTVTGEASGFIAARFAELLCTDAAMIVVDMPIGLSDRDARACETMARGVLKPLRHASVFSSPRRGMLAFAGYPEANAWGKRAENGGKGLSKQAWMIAGKIREIDAAIKPPDQARICEGHPEVAFARLNGGAPCRHPKRRPEGQAERRDLLARAGITNAEAIYETLRAQARRDVARDDVYDACAMALTAKARLEGSALRLGDGARDARGLLMEIWG